MANKRVHLIIEGRVQGVWYRDSARREALRLGLSGWVKNRTDGTVEALVEGPEEDVEALVSWCRKGPPAARVTAIRREDQPFGGNLQSFRIVF